MKVIQWRAPSVLNEIQANKRVKNNVIVPTNRENARVAISRRPVNGNAFELKYLVLPLTVTVPHVDEAATGGTTIPGVRPGVGPGMVSSPHAQHPAAQFLRPCAHNIVQGPVPDGAAAIDTEQHKN